MKGEENIKESLIQSRCADYEQIFCLASKKDAGILTYSKAFWCSPGEKDADKMRGGIESVVP